MSFISLDIFSQNIQNKGITSETEAWLAFLSQDDPEIIIRLINTYPEFRPMYEDVYRLCENIERVVGMFSEELRILDRNTVRYMMDEMQTELDKKSVELESMNTQLQDSKAQLQDANAQLQNEQHENELLRQRIAELEKAAARP